MQPITKLTRKNVTEWSKNTNTCVQLFEKGDLMSSYVMLIGM